LQALYINNKVSNVCAGGDSVANLEEICASVVSRLQLSMGPTSVLPSCTGVIGWRLPTKDLSSDVVPKAIDTLQTESALPVAQAIMTTNCWPKIQSFTLPDGIHIVGIAKGAGMIEPNMAAMLSYIFTNATITQTPKANDILSIQSKHMNNNSTDYRNGLNGMQSPLEPIDLNCSNNKKHWWPKGSKNQI
jgi:glutamate N-acetyltransferase/amino-acid N-acetyltransferase